MGMMTHQTRIETHQPELGGQEETMALPARVNEGEPGALSKTMADAGRGLP